MRLKKLIIDNIRSYKHEEIDFVEGSTLLAGDVGSGKTSVLLSIEFALFGLQPGQKGTSLLRNGEDKAEVSIEFEVDDKNILIKRSLKRGKSISQDYCSITMDGETKEISVMELKNKVLDILNYPKEFSKKQNLLYKFTVYTPQEEMKQIIIQDSNTRLNTLRHVFGIDKYKKILENTSTLTSKLREEKRIKQGLTVDFERDKEEIISKEENLEAKRYNLTSIEKELFLKTEEMKKIKEEKFKISEKINQQQSVENELSKTKLMISSKNDSILENLKRINIFKGEISELETLKFDTAKISQAEQELNSKKIGKEELNEQNLKTTSELASLRMKNSETATTKERLKHIDMCPTCLQDVDPIYQTNAINKLDSDISLNIERIKSLEIEKLSITNKITKINLDISSKEKEIQDLRLLKIKFENVAEKKEKITELERSNFAFEKDIDLLKTHSESLKDSLAELKKFDNVFEEIKTKLEEAFRQEKQAEIKVAELKKEIEVFSYQIDELRKKILRTENIKKELHYISELENWLSKKFAPVISFIEKNVMLKLQSEFSKVFTEWFAMLVPDAFNVRLNDDFTPIIEYNDYEIDYAYLSGGERTAIALAYRLALNQVINSLLSKIKTKDLVILDEPTDGFSDQQLDKMRDVLQQLNVQQLIIVSHEQKIESFVENMIRFNKVEGISKKEE